MNNGIKLFALNSTRKFAERVADFLDVPLTTHEEKRFEDCEPYVRSSKNVRGRDVYVIQSLYSDDNESVDEKFTKLLFFIGSLKDASADRITAVIPYMAYARQDRKVKSREPITTKYFAKLIEAVGTNRLLTMDVHNLSALQNAFRDCIPDNLEAKNLLADCVVEDSTPEEQNRFTVLSPDSGGMGRSRRFRDALRKRLNQEVALAYLDKSHIGESITGDLIIGDVENRLVIVCDDMISGGSSVNECSKATTKHGGQMWGVCATHPLCVGEVNEKLKSIPRIIVTDTILPPRLNESTLAKTRFISTAKMFAQAIRRTHQGESISDLLK